MREFFFGICPTPPPQISNGPSLTYILPILQVFAIVGGTFTVAGIIDSLLFTASELFKKFQLGKLT